MLGKERKKIIIKIVIKAIISGLLLIGIILMLCLINHKNNLSKRRIYEYIAVEYPNLVYDEGLSELSDAYAEISYKTEQCYVVKDDESFLSLYPEEDYGGVGYTVQESNELASEDLIKFLKEDSYNNGNNIKKCNYIGIGIYKKQVCAIALY